MMVVKKYVKNKMIVQVQELTEQTIGANGLAVSRYRNYFSGDVITSDIPYKENIGQINYEAKVEFDFDFQYSYSSYKASFIDGFVKFGSIVVIFLAVWSAVSLCVRYRF